MKQSQHLANTTAMFLYGTGIWVIVKPRVFQSLAKKLLMKTETVVNDHTAHVTTTQPHRDYTNEEAKHCTDSI